MHYNLEGDLTTLSEQPRHVPVLTYTLTSRLPRWIQETRIIQQGNYASAVQATNCNNCFLYHTKCVLPRWSTSIARDYSGRES